MSIGSGFNGHASVLSSVLLLLLLSERLFADDDLRFAG
jgi:hypothetical protein